MQRKHKHYCQPWPCCYSSSGNEQCRERKKCTGKFTVKLSFLNKRINNVRAFSHSCIAAVNPRNRNGRGLFHWFLVGFFGFFTHLTCTHTYRTPLCQSSRIHSKNLNGSKTFPRLKHCVCATLALQFGSELYFLCSPSIPFFFKKSFLIVFGENPFFFF